jgi:RHS repeat-associated protein
MSGVCLRLGGGTRLVLAGLAIFAASLLATLPARASDRVYYYSSDALHSEVVITDQNHNVVERTHYAPYGQVLDRSLRDGPGYTGHAEDPGTGLVYMQQRYYDPVAGRFLSADPVQASAGAGFNRYAYASNNPYRYYDPDGRASEKTKKQVEDVNKPCTGSHIGGQACASLNLSVRRVGSWGETPAARGSRANRYMNAHVNELSGRYASAKDAATAFGDVFAEESGNLGWEFGANIVMNIGGDHLVYNLTDFTLSQKVMYGGTDPGGAYGAPIAGRPGDPTYWGFVHTHYRNDGGFSPGDINTMIFRRVNGYVIFPDKSYQSFSYSKFLHSGLSSDEAYRRQNELSF